MLNKKEQQLFDALAPHAQNHNIEIVTIEIIGSSKSPVIRIFIDTEQGVSFKELTESQEWISAVTEKIDPFPGAYTLEVSSPGIDRPLRTPEHFAKSIGEEVKLRTNQPIDGKSNFRGALKSSSDSKIVIDVDGMSIEIPFDKISRANIVGKIDF